MKPLKKIIKTTSEHPEKIILWTFLVVLVTMSSYLIIRWHTKDPPQGLILPAKPLPGALVLVDFSDLLWEESSYRKSFLRDPFSRLPLFLDPTMCPPIIDVTLDPAILITTKPLPRLIKVMIIGEKRIIFIRIGRNVHRVTGGENINGWIVLSIGEESVALYNKKRGEELILAFRKQKIDKLD